MGLANIAQISITLGAAHVVAVEPNPYRRKQAESTRRHRPRAHTAGRRGMPRPHRQPAADSTSPSRSPRSPEAYLPTMFEALRREATLITIGHPSEPAPIDIATYINKKQIYAARHLRTPPVGHLGAALCFSSSPAESTFPGWSPTASRSAPRRGSDRTLTGDANKILLVPSMKDVHD